MLKKLFSIRSILSILLLLSIGFAGYSIYYKMNYWGFSFSPKKNTNIWTVEAHISFNAYGDSTKVTFSVPSESNEFKILQEDLIADGYRIKNIVNGTKKVVMSSPPTEGTQNIYYRVLLFDNTDAKGRVRASTPKKPAKPILDEQRTAFAKEILSLASKQTGDLPEQVIKTFNQNPPEATVVAFLPMKKTQRDVADAVRTILAVKGIPTRLAYGIKLEENKKSMSPDLMLEAYTAGKWKVYNLQTAQKGLPDNFVIFQRGGDSLLDVEGGEDSTVKFSVLKSITSTYDLAGKRAEIADQKGLFDYSIYSLPLSEQNTIKWLTIFPLAILIIVLMRNVVGVKTMGTFTPMLLSMSLVSTGFTTGIICFGVIMGIGLLIRAILSKLNLLLVPRISAVVIVVILIMQIMTITGYRFGLETASSAVYFPIIIMAWIIERASITWEEDGALNATKEIVNSLIVAVITYFAIQSEYIRHIMFAFNEINLVILLVVMLLGTYTGYRLTELRRFNPIAKKGK